MKIKITLLSLCVLCIQFVNAQFQWSNPYPSGFTNNNIKFIDSLTGFIINTNGDLIKTTDGGNTWNIFKNFPGCSMMNIKDSMIVVGGSDSSMHISNDAGNTWRSSYMKQHHSVTKIEMLNKDTMFVLRGDDNNVAGVLYQSVNGGNTWEMIPNSLVLRSIHFMDSKLGYAGSYDGIYKTRDAGRNWQKIDTTHTSGPITSIIFKNQDTGYAYEYSANIIKTVDGGITWNKLVRPSDRIKFIGFIPGEVIMATGEIGYGYRSKDHGNSWEKLQLSSTAYHFDINAVHFTSPEKGFAVGIRGRILQTTDGGTKWKDYGLTYIDMMSLSFPSGRVGYAASWNDLFKTVDAGNTWQQLPFSLADKTDRFQYIHFFSNDTGIAFANAPFQSYKTYDGGQTWKVVKLPAILIDEFREGFFVKNVGYINIKGTGYSILHTKDRGETWTVQWNEENRGAFTNLFFVNEKTGYGSMGSFLYKTEDSARTWSLIKTNGMYATNAIWFINEAKGFAVASGGQNLVTLDSGKTWDHFPVNETLKEAHTIKFFNEKVGYMTTLYGGMYKTYDGGKTWGVEKSTPWDCKLMEIAQDTTLYIAGTYGAILKKDLREFNIDSLKIVLDNNCIPHLSAKVYAVLSAIDSVWFQYGSIGFDRYITVSENEIRDSSITPNIPVQGLSPDSVYQLRVKVLYNGSYYYSNIVDFRIIGFQRPSVTLNNNTLVSSSSGGNQWYLNNAPISGATNQTYKPVMNGNYSVRISNGTCYSEMSAQFAYVATSINSPVLEAAILIAPNPVKDILNITVKNNRSVLTLLVRDVNGRRVFEEVNFMNSYQLNVKELAAGSYIVTIVNGKTKEQLNKVIIKK